MLLRSLPYHAEAAKQPTFRNSDGIGFKLMNIRQVATGSGLGNVSSMDRQVWAEFGRRPDEVRRIAEAIKSGITVAAAEQLPEVDIELPEGRLLTALHVRRERNPKVKRMLLTLDVPPDFDARSASYRDPVCQRQCRRQCSRHATWCH